MRCALRQYKVQARLGQLALTDELTGLYNRRGFFVLSERQLKLARRSSRGLWLFLIDVDGLKQINDSRGHAVGDQALIQTGEVLKATFRDSDVIARLGGDEFAVLAVGASGRSAALITARLQDRLRKAARPDSSFNLSLSSGVACFDPRCASTVEELLVQADQAMYDAKRRIDSPGGRRVAASDHRQSSIGRRTRPPAAQKTTRAGDLGTTSPKRLNPSPAQ